MPMDSAVTSVFVSSTFQDMQVERDLLRDRVIPALNDFASRWGRSVEMIDLRWGVDTASVSEAESGVKVLRTCLSEIARSRPYFIALLGDRYGWVPPPQDVTAALAEQGIPSDGLLGSVTALEIEIGALRAPSPHSFFYMRQPLPYADMPPDLRARYLDQGDLFTRQQKLKEAIHSAFGAQVHSYPVSWNGDEVTGLSAFVEQVTADLMTHLEQVWGDPLEEGPSWQQAELRAQWQFVGRRSDSFIGRKALLEELRQRLLAHPTPKPLLLTGPSGLGKSALMAKLLTLLADEDCTLLLFFAGISARSTDISVMLRLWIHSLCSFLKLEDTADSLTSFEDLKERLLTLLREAASHRRVVLVVDALNQFYPSEESRRMLWMTGLDLPNVSLLATGFPAEEKPFSLLGGELRTLQPLLLEEAQELTYSIADHHHKQLDTRVWQAIAAKRDDQGTQICLLPLYIRMLMLDLVMIDRYEHAEISRLIQQERLTPSDAIAAYMISRVESLPGTLEAEFTAVILRIERLVGAPFTKAILGLLAVSRYGLRESDLMGALEQLRVSAPTLYVPYSSADFSWIRQLLPDCFLQTDTLLWDFSHQSLRSAVLHHLGEDTRLLHLVLAAHYFPLLPKGDAVARSEMLWHLRCADLPDRAIQLLTQPSLVDGDLRAYTPTLVDICMLEIGQPGAEGHFLRQLIDQFSAVEPDTVWLPASYLLTGLLPALPDTFPSKTLLSVILALREALERHRGATLPETQAQIATSLGKEGDVYKNANNQTRAADCYRQAAAVAKSVAVAHPTNRNLRDLALYEERVGVTLRKCGQLQEALEWLERSLHTSQQAHRSSQNSKFPSNSVQAYSDIGYSNLHLGVFYLSCDDPAQALPFLHAAESNFDRVCHCAPPAQDNWAKAQLGGALRRMSDCLLKLGRTEEAGDYLRRDLAIRQEAFLAEGTPERIHDLAISHGRMGDYLRQIGQAEQAEQALTRSVEALALLSDEREGEIDEHYALSCLNLGIQQWDLGEHDRAVALFRKCRDILAAYDTATMPVSALGGLAWANASIGRLYLQREEFALAIPSLCEWADLQLEICKRQDTPRNWEMLAEAARNAVDILGRFRRSTQRTSYVDMLELALSQMERQGGDTLHRIDAHQVAGDQAVMEGNPEAATAHFGEMLSLCLQAYRENGTVEMLRALSVAHSKMGEGLQLSGQTEEALEHFRRSCDYDLILTAALPNDATVLRDLAVSHCNLADCLTILRNPDEAGVEYLHSLALRQQLAQTAEGYQSLWDVAYLQDRLGGHFARAGQSEDACRWYARSANLRKRISRRFGEPELAIQHLETLEKWGVCMDAWQPNRHWARLVLRQALVDGWRTLRAEQPDDTRATFKLPGATLALGQLLLEADRPEESIVFARETAEIWHASLEQNPTYEVVSGMALVLELAGNSNLATGGRQNAVSCFESALGYRKLLASTKQPDEVQPYRALLQTLLHLYHQLGRTEQAAQTVAELDRLSAQ